MTYQFSFDDPAGSTTVTDKVSGASADVFNSPFTGTDGSGNLIFDGGAGYLALAPNILTNYGGVSVEFWASLGAVGTWARFFDFGTGPTVNMFMTPAAGGGFLRTAFTVGGGGGETQVNYSFGADVGNRHHYVFTAGRGHPHGKAFPRRHASGVDTNFTLTPEDEGQLPTTGSAAPNMAPILT